MSDKFSRLLRFIPSSDPSKTLVGEPVDSEIDVGVAIYNKLEVKAYVFSGSSILSPGHRTDIVEAVGTLLCPLAQSEVGTIRCIGLNYRSHALECGFDVPTIPTVFLKPAAALASPFPAPCIIPMATQHDDTGDYESELAVIIGKDCKNIEESNAMDYVLGYAAANDISSRGCQLSQSQWCFSKGFDGSCPLGPTVVSKTTIPDPSDLHIKGIKNGHVLQDCALSDLILSVPKLIAFLSQSTTLPAGTVILTGTPGGIGAFRKPRETIREGDVFAVEILPHIGTLISCFKNESL